MVAGDTGAAREFDLAKIEGESADYDRCDAVGVACEIVLASRQWSAQTWSIADLKDPRYLTPAEMGFVQCKASA